MIPVDSRTHRSFEKIPDKGQPPISLPHHAHTEYKMYKQFITRSCAYRGVHGFVSGRAIHFTCAKESSLLSNEAPSRFVRLN